MTELDARNPSINGSSTPDSPPEPERPATGTPLRPWPGLATDPSYTGVHDRLRRWLGPASSWRCARPGCDRQAQDWAYKGDAPDERISARGFPFSAIPAWYEPLCRRHHAPNTGRTHCPAGHPYSGPGSDVSRSPSGKRRCRHCRRARRAGDVIDAERAA